MRLLSRIIFINSAHIRYGEVALNGNVHFTGTQGVGKTTLLRALLFFYNADKEKLGLRKQSQRTFDDYYVPTPASYIVYEVTRGDGERPFCAILFRHKNRAAFRFVDAPFSKDWLIDEQGMVASDHLTVRQRIQEQGIDVSCIVDHYSTYLDVIYGNRTAKLPKDLLKYYLLRSQQYQNIRRIIQNVFLNERVDAGFIKSTIISSISADDEVLSIDLKYFRSRLVDFANELSDISLWNTPNKAGVVETRRDADKIIKTSSRLKASEFSIREHCGMLNYARRRAERDVPLLNDKIEKKLTALTAIDAKIKDLKATYESERDKANQKIGELSAKLKEAASLRKKYQAMSIEEMIARVSNLPALRLDLEQKKAQLAQLRLQFSSISEKYRALISSLELDRSRYVQSRKEQAIKANSDCLAKSQRRHSQWLNIEQEILKRHKLAIEETEREITDILELLHQQELQRQKASLSFPLKAEIDACNSAIATLDKQEAELWRRKLEKENRLQALSSKFENECQKLEAEFCLRESELQAKIDRLSADCEKEKQLLDDFKGSFCQWLDENVAGWEHSVGKVVDEKGILYAQNLNPRLTGTDPASLFGIAIDLEAADKEVRTPSMIERSIKAIETEVAALQNGINSEREHRDFKINEIGKVSTQEQKSVRNEIAQIEYDLEQCRRKRTSEQLRIEDIKKDQAARLKKIDSEYADEIGRLKIKAETLRTDLTAKQGKRDQELKKAKKKYEDDDKKDRSELSAIIAAIDAEVNDYCKDCAAKINSLKAQELSELTDSGADVKMIESLNHQIASANDKIELIEKEKVTVGIYDEDCNRLLNHEAEFLSKKKNLEEKSALLRQKHTEKVNKLDLDKEQEKKALAELKQALDSTQEQMRLSDEFAASSACQQLIAETAAIPTALNCIAIIEEIKNLTSEKYCLTDSLKSCINEFHRRFSSANTFKFPLNFDNTEGYLNFADSLEDFVTNDKIKEFQLLTSKIYREILSRIGSEFNNLLSREAEIKRIVKEINYDFSQKTFAGVIRSIELRLDRSETPIIIKLQAIAEFWSENQFDIDQLNLFSTEDHDSTNREAIKHLKSLTDTLTRTADLNSLSLEQIFSLKFKVEENDNSTDWTENLKAVGSEGTDILVKAIMNILLVSVFKKRVGQAGDFRIHCMMDEIGRLADENIQGILEFANQRGIFIVNSSPKAHRPLSYRHLYSISKDKEANTKVELILSTRESQLL